MLITLDNIKTIIKFFLENQGFLYLDSYINIPIGACTFHRHTINFMKNFFNNKEQKNLFFFEICYRPFDKINSKGVRSDKHTQLQILCLDFDGKNLLKEILKHLFNENIFLDLYFYEDNWSAPTMCANGYGWEARIFNLEVAQITYFKKFGDIEIKDYRVVEVTIGIERLLMIKNKQKNILEVTNKNITDFENIIAKTNNEFLIENIEKAISEKHIYNYEDILKLNNYFNVLDYRGYFSEGIKNMYLFEISKIFKIFFYETICKT